MSKIFCKFNIKLLNISTLKDNVNNKNEEVSFYYSENESSFSLLFVAIDCDGYL